MSGNQLVINNAGSNPMVDLSEVPARLRVTALSIKETVRSRVPLDDSKYDRNEKVDELYLRWSQSPASPPENRYETVVLLFWELYRPRIMAIARKYRSLSPVFDDDDLQQTGLLGIFQALTKYDHAEHIDMRFSTYLEWSVRNVFQRTIGYADKFVEIYDNDDGFLRVISYREFLVRKKTIVSEGHKYIIRSRQCYLSDMQHTSRCGPQDAPFLLAAAEHAGWDESDDRS
ncbi:MAG: Sigma-70 region 2 [Syntrophorhabdus sp. PtaB.Bin047]|jgi:hypothetical protein|nr:MAG: Sigma-70 region 2 [Syntrophorhabdus sp. PtaB.Bin047]